MRLDAFFEHWRLPLYEIYVLASYIRAMPWALE